MVITRQVNQQRGKLLSMPRP